MLIVTRFQEHSKKTLLVEFNNPIFLSAGIVTKAHYNAGVKRRFSLGKDVLCPKRAGLSDAHFPKCL